MVNDDDRKTPPEGTRRNAALAQRSAEARALSNVAGALATAADQLSQAGQRYDSTAGNDRRMLEGSLVQTIERARDACDDAVLAFDPAQAPTVNWKAVPWKKLGLLVIAGAVAGAAGAIPPELLIAGYGLQKVLLFVSGTLAGWAKRAPGDVKALPPL